MPFEKWKGRPVKLFSIRQRDAASPRVCASRSAIRRFFSLLISRERNMAPARAMPEGSRGMLPRSGIMKKRPAAIYQRQRSMAAVASSTGRYGESPVLFGMNHLPGAIGGKSHPECRFNQPCGGGRGHGRLFRQAGENEKYPSPAGKNVGKIFGNCL